MSTTARANRTPGQHEARMFEQALELAQQTARDHGATDAQVADLELRLRRHVGPALFTLPAGQRRDAVAIAEPTPPGRGVREAFEVLYAIAEQSSSPAFDL